MWQTHLFPKASSAFCQGWVLALSQRGTQPGILGAATACNEGEVICIFLVSRPGDLGIDGIVRAYVVSCVSSNQPLTAKDKEEIWSMRPWSLLS